MSERASERAGLRIMVELSCACVFRFPGFFFSLPLMERCAGLLFARFDSMS